MMKTVVLINLLYLHFAFKLKKDKRLEALIKRQPILHVKTDDIKQLDLNVNMKIKERFTVKTQMHSPTTQMHRCTALQLFPE